MTLDPRVEQLVAPELDPGYRRRVATVMQWLPPSDATDSHVVDIGCGRGYFVHYYARLGQRAVTGVERDPDIAAKAARLNAAAAQVSIVRADAAHLPLPDRAFSGAILSEVLEHVADDEAVLAEAFRVLRPGGVVAITVPHERYPWSWDPPNRALAALGLPPIRRGPLAGVWAEHLRLYSIGTLRDKVRAAGFVVERERAFLRHCLPFAHLLLYGIGKPLLESGWLPSGLAGAIDRSRHDEDAPGRSRAAALLRSLLSIGDSRNRDDEGFDVPTLNLAIKARKPAP